MSLPITNEDHRRRLTSFPDSKILEIKEDCVIGKHYHKLKTEYFVLCEGTAKLITIPVKTNVKTIINMRIGDLTAIIPYAYHEFHIKKGSVLIGLCTKVFDPKDDYKI